MFKFCSEFEESIIEYNWVCMAGFFYPCSSFAVAVNVTGKRCVKAQDQGESPVIMYYVNDGIYGLFNCSLYNTYAKMLLFPEAIKVSIL